jgi:hypothetical protein
MGMRGGCGRAKGATALAVAVAAAGCGPAAEEPVPESVVALAPAVASPIRFSEIATAAGIDFVHRNGAGGRFFYPELMQGGAGLVDVDGDGDLDAYLVQSGPLPPDGSESASNRLYLNDGDGGFVDATAVSGTGDRGYGSGVAVGDYDGDGDLDLYVTNLGRNTLYRNGGEGVFVDVTAAAGVGDERYSTSAVFFDYDGDGDLDLYVCNYVDWSVAVERTCRGPMGLVGYCSPSEYEAPADSLYRNEGDGRFVDVSVTSGVAAARSTGLGVVAADFDDDGRVDLYVANDQRPNFLWMNRGDGTFREEALLRGNALNELGQPEAGMGVAVADPDGDGDWDLFVSHLGGETNTYYRNQGDGFFVDATDELGLGAVSQPFTGFGTGFADFDHDGALDLFLANGKVSPGDSVQPDYREPNQVFSGRRGGRFEDVSAGAGASLELLEVSRAAAFGDIDGDGDVDVLMVNNEGPARLYRNDIEAAGHWLAVKLRDRPPNPHGVGATLELRSGDRVSRRLVQPSYSYCASNDLTVHFGLGDAARVDLSVRWPDGSVQELRDVEADRRYVVERELAGEGGV